MSIIVFTMLCTQSILPNTTALSISLIMVTRYILLWIYVIVKSELTNRCMRKSYFYFFKNVMRKDFLSLIRNFNIFMTLVLVKKTEVPFYCIHRILLYELE